LQQHGWGDSNSGPPPQAPPGNGCAGWLTCDSLLPIVTACARRTPHLPGPRVPTVYRVVPSGRGRLRRSGPPPQGTDRPAGHGKADEGVMRNSRLLVGLVVVLAVGTLRLTDSMPLMALALLS
jgi:hypothetical protein